MPISYSGRTYAEGKKISWKDGVRALWAICRYAASDKIYAADGHGGEILLRLNRAPRFSRWMADVIRPYAGSRVLELGAGIGNLTTHLVPRAAYWATDINPEYLDNLQRLRANRPYLRVAHVDATDAATFPTEQSFDTVIFLNVLEHLADDAGALRNVQPGAGKRWNRCGAGSQRPGAVMEPWTKCSDIAGATRGNSWSQWGSPRVSKSSALLKFNRTGVVAWWLNGKILRRRTFGLAQIRLLNLLTPLFRALDPWLPLPPLSLIAIFRKDGGLTPMSGSLRATIWLMQIESRDVLLEHRDYEISIRCSESRKRTLICSRITNTKRFWHLFLSARSL